MKGFRDARTDNGLGPAANEAGLSTGEIVSGLQSAGFEVGNWMSHCKSWKFLLDWEGYRAALWLHRGRGWIVRTAGDDSQPLGVIKNQLETPTKIRSQAIEWLGDYYKAEIEAAAAIEGLKIEEGGP